jgi:hypothetical protein
MYPANLFGLFPPFPREEKVFVAMSFDPRFDNRWRDVIAPAIRHVAVNGTPLEPVRVDMRRVSDSILTEILTGITNSRLIFADVTTIGVLDGRPVRNGNVLYEVGIAHAVRLPEEVILFRSDNDPLLFDMANVRVNFYQPEEALEDARGVVSDTIVAAVKEIDLHKHLAVKKAAESLDFPSWWLLAEAQAQVGIAHPAMRTFGQALGNASRANAISRLLELGAIKTTYLNVTPELFTKIADSTDTPILTYECTEFGKAVFQEGMARMGLFSPEMQEILEKSIQGEGQP